MSPHVDPASALPQKRRRHHDPLDRMIAEALDDQLVRYALSQDSFSIPEVRDQLLTLPELEGVDLSALRYRVRDRLKTLQNHELVDEVGIARRRPKLFRMRPEVAAEAPADPSPDHRSGESPGATSADSAVLLSHLEQERRRLQTTMQVAMGEAEHYKRLMTQFPDASRHISPLLEAAIEQSSALQGQWEANLKLRRALSDDTSGEVEAGDEEGQA